MLREPRVLSHKCTSGSGAIRKREPCANKEAQVVHSITPRYFPSTGAVYLAYTCKPMAKTEVVTQAPCTGNFRCGCGLRLAFNPGALTALKDQHTTKTHKIGTCPSCGQIHAVPHRYKPRCQCISGAPPKALHAASINDRGLPYLRPSSNFRYGQLRALCKE